MLRVLLPLVLSAIFFGWLMYHLFIKKDLKNHWNEVFGGFFFMAVWGLIYYGLSA